MADAPNLALPYIEAAQAQKHVTHNEAIRALDAIVQLGVVDRDLAVPPGSPGEGERYIVASSASGGWSGMEAQIAAWQDGAWAFYEPQEGWLAWVVDEEQLVSWDGDSWILVSAASAPLFGVNSTGDATNRLSVKSDAVLFSHDDVTPGSGSIRATLNKDETADTASFLFQVGYSGRGEIGLTGNDDFSFKVSPDGSVWNTALVFERNSGVPRLPSHSVAGVPSASLAGAGGIVFISDETSGAVLAFSDGANWRRVTDRAVIS